MRNTPENAIKRQIKDWLTLNGFDHWPLPAGLASPPGMPDRIAIKKGVVLWIEIKGPDGKQGPRQREFQQKLERQGGHYILAYDCYDVHKYCEERGLCLTH